MSNGVNWVLAELCRTIVSQGGMVVLPQNSQLVMPNSGFCSSLLKIPGAPQITLSYGQKPDLMCGLHIMECESDSWVRNLD